MRAHSQEEKVQCVEADLKGFPCGREYCDIFVMCAFVSHGESKVLLGICTFFAVVFYRWYDY